MRKYRSISCEGRKGCLFNAGGSGNLFHLYLSFTENRRAWWPYGNGQRGTVFCAVAARLGISLGEKEEQIHIIPGSYEIEESRQFSGTRIYMKSGRKLKQLKEMLQKESTIRPLEVYSVSDCGKEEEKVFSGVDNIPENSGYFTIVIVKTKDEPVHNSSRFFENRACAYYPCHRDIEQINCMFCYCPMYEMEHCPGTPEYKETNGRKLKICTNCTYPHQAEHYDAIMKVLTHRLKG